MWSYFFFWCIDQCSRFFPRPTSRTRWSMCFLQFLSKRVRIFFGFLKHDLIFELFQLLFVQKVLCVKCLFWQCHRISTEIFVFQFSVDFFYLFGSFSNFFCAPRYFTFVSCRIEQYLRKVFLETLFGSIRMSFWRVGWILIPSHIFYVFCEAPFLSCVVRFEFGVLQPFLNKLSVYQSIFCGVL